MISQSHLTYLAIRIISYKWMMTLGVLNKLCHCMISRKDTYNCGPTGMDFQHHLCKTGLPALRIPNRLCSLRTSHGAFPKRRYEAHKVTTTN